MYVEFVTAQGNMDLVDVYECDYIAAGHVFRRHRHANCRMTRMAATVAAARGSWLLVGPHD